MYDVIISNLHYASRKIFVSMDPILFNYIKQMCVLDCEGPVFEIFGSTGFIEDDK